MNFLSQAQVERIRQKYPPGTEVELIAMPEDPYPVPPGTRGKVIMVDDTGQLVMKWSNSSKLSLIPGVDQSGSAVPRITMIRLWMMRTSSLTALT